LTTHRPSVFQRLLVVGGGIASFVLFLAVAVTGQPLVAFFCLPALMMILEGVRAEVAVDGDRDVVRTTRAIRRTVVPMGDIEAVAVAGRGPMGLVLRADAPKPGGSRRGVVLTGLYVDRRDRDGTAAALGAEIGVPVRGLRA
jgi:hypothetical protein